MEEQTEVGSNSEEQFGTAKRRLQEFIGSIDPDFVKREDSLPKTLRLMNASPTSKLRKIYNLTDEIKGTIEPFVACKKGCSACCRMNVMISDLEAKLIQSVTGRRYTQLKESKPHELADFNGVPCPFLKDTACSIYADRPFACRKHYSFDTSDFWCQPEHSATENFPLLALSGAYEAYTEISGVKSQGVVADIRDFFPDNA